MSATVTASPARGAQSADEAPLLPLPVARIGAFVALAAFGGVLWARMVDPPSSSAQTNTLLAATAAGILLSACRHRRARERAAATVAAAVLLLLVALLGAGVPADLLRPGNWDDLAAGIGQGLSSVSTVRVPYAGLDEWTRIVIVLGGTALVAVAALLAFAPRRDGRLGYPLAAAVALGTLYATPVMQRNPDAPFISGAAFLVLLALFLWLERVERRSLALAGCVVAAAAVAGLALAPRLDASGPLLDYEELAQSIGAGGTTRYDWNHGYGPLRWPRDGREVLRVKAPQRAYWKTVNLTDFDGRRWLQAARSGGRIDAPVLEPDWVHRIRVTIRALQSTLFVTAGSAVEPPVGPRVPIAHAPGLYETAGRPLQRGNTYEALVYVPRPSAQQMQEAGTFYPDDFVYTYGAVDLPHSGGTATVLVPLWDAPGDRDAILERQLRGTRYDGIWELAQRLRRDAETPYEYMRAVERYLADGFRYEESPPVSAMPLADFLLRTKEGYCQHFSGAMALLLRLGGVPARVSSGFSPGVLNVVRDEYVVRDIDAHSWVEVYFPGIGWVTRDPTPADSPARTQLADLQSGDAAAPATSEDDRASGALNRFPAGDGAAASSGGEEASPWPARIVVALAAAAVLAAVALLLLRRRRRRGRADAPFAEDQLAELRRALRRSRRTPPAALTLAGLADRWRNTPAEGYVRALVEARYGYAAAGPTPAQRADLRRELAAGHGLRGRLRAWWALPPRIAPSRDRDRASATSTKP